MPDNEHPNLKQFRSKLDGRKVDGPAAAGFFQWLSNPGKCSGEVKAEADRLWDRYQKEMGGKPHVPRAPSPQPASAHGARAHGAAHRGGGRGHEGGFRGQGSGGGGGLGRGPRGGDGVAGSNDDAAEPHLLGEAFHNPYTFIRFPRNGPERVGPTPLTIDEIERDRFTGTIHIEVETLSPLLTCNPEPVQKVGDHAIYAALTIGQDVVVPATGVRGAFRSLMTILAGGTLSYVDEEAWLCQGRDATLGPRGKYSPAAVPAHSFLAEVVQPGNASRAGKVILGKTRLVKVEVLEAAARRAQLDLQLLRPKQGQQRRYYYTDEDCSTLVAQADPTHAWKVKLSGRPVNSKGKREGLFQPNGAEIDLPPNLWAAYSGRNRHGEFQELRKGDLVWLEPSNPDLQAIEGAEHVKSIQWARWGREGERLLEVVRGHHAQYLPDCANPDGLVDEVTNLFGQVPRRDLVEAAFGNAGGPGPAGPFAARLRFDNLVFRGAVREGIERVTLAPLAPPHPGCAAFYRDWDGSPGGLDRISNHQRGLRGYKVYRRTKETGQSAPWQFDAQGVYGDRGELKESRQRVNKTCDLLKAGWKGSVSLACRGLSRRELALVFATCAADWRLGGGKPLGLGACRVLSARAFDEEGHEVLGLEPLGVGVQRLPVELARAPLLTEREIGQMKAWQASQEPVERLRYPRAVTENKNKKNRGGHAWFARHAVPKKTLGDDQHPIGLQVLWLDGDLKQRADGKEQMRAQALPPLAPDHPLSDVLFGHDLFSGESEEFRTQPSNRRTFHRKLEPWNPEQHGRPTDRGGGLQGPNRGTRQDERARRDRS